MTGVAPHRRDVRSTASARTRPRADDAVLTELCSALFASLPRSDQRRKGTAYLRGLLEAPGRKTVRNIAALAGGESTEQNLHHFVCESTWDWDTMRRALAWYVVRHAPPQAWVVRPMVIPKAGQHSVGVDRRFFPALGEVRTAQQAVGVWAASERTSTPVNWRLHLPRPWLDDGARRSRASIPDEMGAETLADCVVRAYREAATRWELPERPVVADARDSDAMATVAKLRATGAPLLARVDDALPLVAADHTLPGRGAEPRPARQIAGAVRARRRPVACRDHGPVGTMRTSLAAAVRVRMPGRPARRGDLLLLGVGAIGQRWPGELWLTDLADASPATLLRLRQLVQRVDRDLTEIADRVGLRDFAGRSYDGWHRHVTLASAAHAVAALADAPGRPMSQVS
jgi:DDE superfamily endonuclease